MAAIKAEAIRAAHGRVPAAFRDTPQFVAEALTERAGVPVVVKAEGANPIGSFKGRGTWLAVQELAGRGEVGEESGLVVASAGNFGQGVAYACRALSIPIRVYAPQSANPSKLAAMRRLGAEVVLEGEDFDASRAAAAADAAEGGWRLLVDGQDPWIAIGAGGMAVELSRGIESGELPDIGRLYVPVGNGALIGGVGAWFKASRPEVAIIGVQAEGAPAMTLSWRASRPVETAEVTTVADGISVRVPVPEALAVMEEVVDEMMLVSDAAILDAQRQLQHDLPFVIEPSAAAGWAAARDQPQERAIGLILTGGNVAPVS